MRFIHVACVWICVLFYSSFVCPCVYAYDFKFKVHCGSALEPGASKLPYYCAPRVCVPAVLGGLAVCRHNKPKTKNQEWRNRTTPKKERKSHELVVCWIVNMLIVLNVQQARLYLHYWI